MELRHLRYFVAVAEEQNVTRAAARLHLSQPALSRQVRDLEEHLGVTLLERGAKSIRLTEAGRIFLSEARAVLERAGEAVKNVRAVAGGLQGEIHVGYAPSLTVQILPKALRLFQGEFPRVRVALHDFSTEQMLSGVRDGTLHVALGVLPTGEKLRGLHFRELARYAMGVAMAPGHPLARGRSVNRAKLAGAPLIAYTRADYPEYHASLEALFEPTGHPPRIVEEHDSVTSLIAAVEAARGVAIVPGCMECMVGPRLKILSLTPPFPPIVVGAIRREGPGSSAVENFIAAAAK
ncbi:MAG: LysR substrate-binding domain-containing protein [Verrucomicrobiota bacterium]